MTVHMDYVDQEFYEKAYDILVRECNANESLRADFVARFCDLEYPCKEYRFMGYLGGGGKFWRGENFWVSCYPEDDNPIRRETINRVNGLLEKLAETYHPHDRYWWDERQQEIFSKIRKSRTDR